MLKFRLSEHRTATFLLLMLLCILMLSGTFYPGIETKAAVIGVDPGETGAAEPMAAETGVDPEETGAAEPMAAETGVDPEETGAAEPGGRSSRALYTARPSVNGKLHVDGAQLVDEEGRAIQLRGVSTQTIEIIDFGDDWFEYQGHLYDRLPTLSQTLNHDLGILSHLWQNIAHRVARTRK